MKLKLLVLAFLCSVTFVWGQSIFTNPITFAATVPPSPYTAGQVVDPNITVSGISRGSGITGASAGNRYTATGWSTGAIDLNDYFEFTLTPNSGYQINFVSFVYTGQVSTGTPNHAFRSSIDGFATNIGVPTTTGTTISLTGGAYQNITSSITFRFYSFGLAAAGTTFSINDFTFNGTVISTSSNTITTNTALTGSPFCVSGSTGATVSIPFTSIGTFNAGNVYTAQLSNAAGSFAAPTNIGTVTSTLNSDVISATIPAGTAAGTGYRIRVVSNNPVVTGTDNTVNLTVQNSAAITVQPSTTVQNVCQNIAATALSVTATGTTLTYQWYSNTLNSNAGGTLIATATSSSYTPDTSVAGTLYYYCVVSAACGAPVTSSVSGAVNVTSAPSAPAGTINISANPSCGAATLTYSAPNANIYWQTTATGTSTANPTTSSFLSLATAGTYIRYVRELNGTCWGPATASASFTVVEPVVITTQPPTRVINDGSNTTFNVVATGTGLTYQWQVDTGSGFVNLTNVAPYSNVTTATMTITAAPITMNGYVYRCVVSGSAPCGNVTSNNGSLTVNYTAPNNPTAIVPCYGNNTLGLSWTASSGGSAPDGYMVFALAGATAPTATAAVAGNASLYTANADFSLATVVTASLGKCIYKGTGTSVTVTGLTNLSNYSFKVVAYRGNTSTGWSSGINTAGSWSTPTTNIIIDMPEVTALAASIASGQSALTWTRPTPLACYDEYLVVANQGAVVFTPSGDGTAYTANTVYTGPNQVVYKGTGNGVTVTGLTNGTSYCYKVFVRRGTEWSDGVQVCQTPNIVYCSLTATNTGFEYISNVTVGTDINNTTTSTGYTNYTAQVANASIGSGVPVSVTVSSSYATDNVYVYVDWNQDGDWLDASEIIPMTYTAAATTFTATGTITPPVTALLGNTRMRVVVVDGSITNSCNGGSNFTYGEVEDYTINVVAACVPTHTVSSVTPTSGPVGTEVTINGTNLTGATATFSGINATVLSNTGTQMVVVIPSGATTGVLAVKDAQPCAINTAYTIITNDNSTCEGSGAAPTDLIIYDIHDEYTGSGGFITIYNGTAAVVDLTNYSIWRTSNYGDGNEIDYATTSGTIAPGALGILKVSVGSCGPASTNGTIDSGFNENDGIQLRNAAGTVIIDDVHTYTTGPGYYMVRNTGALSARTTFVPADWNTTPLVAGQCWPSAGLVLPVVTGNSPTVTLNPVDVTATCISSTANLSVAGTEGFAGGLSLAYQWYVNVPGNSGWTAVTDGGVYSGATTSALAISSTSGLNNYQYYCQIRENAATCYTATDAAIIKDGSTIWDGTTWSNGVPDLTKLAIINGNYNTTSHGNIDACSIIVNVGFTATITANSYFNIQNDVTVNGTLNVLNNGSLVQINDAGVNTGSINYERIPSVKLQDYVYWSSPVSNFDVNSISPLTPAYYHWSWNPTLANLNGGQGYWENASTNMIAGKGYIVRAPNGFSNVTNQNWNVQFTGVPFNGIYTPTISRGNDLGAGSAGPNGVMRLATDDNWNLLGNPYPSSISINSFLTANTNIDGFVRLWTHGTLPSTATTDPFYDNFVSNYTASDYIAINGAGATSGPGTLSVIGGGQGFFVLMNPGAATSSTVTFNNAMRDKSFSNAQFYRNSSSGEAAPIGVGFERNGIWLDLVSNETQNTTRALVAYVSEATYAKDRMYDALTDYKEGQNIYSLIGDDIFAIQGRPVPFDVNDKVPMGVKIPSTGTYKIAIAAVDGLFTNSGNGQKIYLEDTFANSIHDLTVSPYEFTASSGVINNRFILRYTNQALNTDTFSSDNELIVYATNQLNVKSSQNIKQVKVFDVLGRLIFNSGKGTTNEVALPVAKNSTTLILEIELENGVKMYRKTIF